MIYRLCFHKGSDLDPKAKLHQKLLSKLIRAVTHGPYSHVELQRGQGGPCFSSDGYANRVRWKKINFSHPEWWDFVDLGDVPIRIDKEIMKRCTKIDGAKYDYVGAVCLPWKGHNPANRWWCSEAVAYVLDLRPYNLSPTELCKAASKILVS